MTKEKIMEIKAQGRVRVNGARVVARQENIALIEVDLCSKRPRILEFHEDGGAVGVYLYYAMDKQVTTEIIFPAFNGWEIFSSHVARYTLRVALVRRPF